jgi:hypothetical protein
VHLYGVDRGSHAVCFGFGYSRNGTIRHIHYIDANVGWFRFDDKKTLAAWFEKYFKKLGYESGEEFMPGKGFIDTGYGKYRMHACYLMPTFQKKSAESNIKLRQFSCDDINVKYFSVKPLRASAKSKDELELMRNKFKIARK